MDGPDPDGRTPLMFAAMFDGLVLIGDEERHQNQYEREQENIRRFGPSYLALQAMQASSSEPPAEPRP